MKLLQAISSVLITAFVLWMLNRSWTLGDIRIPPPAKFLDPFHGFWQNAETPVPALPDHLSLPDLQGDVTVWWDSLLIPHIYATHEYDLYAAQGYVTALHRLWQMEFQTHAAAGRLSEILGAGKDSAVLNYDRKQRRLGMVFAAENALKGMEKNATARAMLKAYAAGVNTFVASLKYRDLPLEYKLLDYEPEPWTPLKAALLLRSMAQTLNMGDKDVQMTNALKLFGPDTLNLLYPDREQVGDAIVEKPGKWPVVSQPLASLIHPAGIFAGKGGLPPAGQEETPMASNNWAVSGSKTRTGHPMLCNDPHLNTTLPSIWYAIHLNGPGVNTLGVSLPGAPGVIIGLNDSIAWGVTNAQRDLVDWYRITFVNGTKDLYVLDGNAVATDKHIETIRIRGQQPFIDTVIYTRWGPVPYDDRFQPGHNLKHCAFRWIAHDESEEVMTFYYLNRARNYNDFMRALDYYSSPAQNFIFASATGDVAIRIQGKFPIRKKDEGRFVLDGSTSASAPPGFIPFEHNVMDTNPTRGFVSSANQYPADSTYPYYITATSYEAYRNRRINSRLREMNGITVEDMMNLQNDTYSIKAEEVLPLLLQATDTARLTSEQRQMLQSLAAWNYYYNPLFEAPCYFETWWSNLYALIWDELQNDSLLLAMPTSFTTISLMKRYPNLRFFDIRKTPQRESLSDLIQLALNQAVDEIKEWKTRHAETPLQWGYYKDTYVEHLLRLEALSRKVFHGGHANTVNASSRKHGPSWRMVVSLEPKNPQVYAVYPGGQSGNAGSAFYDNLLMLWANARYVKLTFPANPESLKPKAFTQTHLHP